MFAKNLENY